MNKKDHVIVHLAPYYPPHLGGLERVAQKSAVGLAKHGYTVKVITTTQSGIKRGTTTDQNLTVTSLPSFEFAHTPFAPTLFWHLLRLPKNSILHLHLSQAYFPEHVLLVAKLRRIPYIVHFHLDVDVSGFLGPLFLIYKKLIWGPLLKNAKHVIVCSPDQTEIVTKKYGVKPENTSLIINAVGNDFFYDRPPKKPVRQLKLLYIGRLSVQKQVSRLIKMMSKITAPATLTIIGDGEEKAELEKLTKKNNLKNIYFLGRKNDTEMIEYQRKSDLFLISSDQEGTALVVLEAMASGLPIVGTNVKGIKDLLAGTGVLVDEPYSDNFAKVVDHLWANPAELAQLSEKSKAKARLYSWGEFMIKLEKVYAQICV